MFGIEKLAEEIRSLRVDVAAMRADLDTLMFREAGREAPAAEPAADPVTERINRMFAEGLDAVFSYDGKAKTHDEVKGDAE